MDNVLTGLAAIVALGIAAYWLAWRLRLPAILMLLIVGFVAGPATGYLRPDLLLGDTLLPIVSLSVAVILFEGALSLRFSEIAEVRGAIARLVSLGVLVSWALGSVFALFVLGLTVQLALLLGAVLVVTGPTVVIPLLRHIQPNPRIRAVLRWEGIANDVVGAILTVLVLYALLADSAGAATAAIFVGLATTLAVGIGLSALGALLLVTALKRYWIPDFLESPVTLAVVLASYALSNELQREAGVLTVTLMGVMLANQQVVKLGHIIEFKENLRTLLICGLFVVLAARIELHSLATLGWASAAFLALLILVVRPMAVLVSTVGSNLPWKERLFVGAMAPRGIVAAAVSSLMALELVHEAVPGAERLLAETFAAIGGTVVIYGIGAKYVARWLGLSCPDPQGVVIVGAHFWARQIALTLEARGFEVLLLDNDPAHVQAASALDLRVQRADLASGELAAHVDLSGIGKLIALSPIDEVNVLAALQFAPALGRENIYHLAARTPRVDAGTKTMDSRERGRTAFGDSVSFDNLDGIFRAGGRLRSTLLSPSIDYATLRHRIGLSIPLFLVRKQRLELCSADSTIDPTDGDVMVSVAIPEPRS